MKRIANLLALSGALVAVLALVSARTMQLYWRWEIDNALLSSRINTVLVVAMILVFSGTLLALLSRDVRFPRKVMMTVLSVFVLGFWIGVLHKDNSLAELCELYPTDKCGVRHNYVEMYERLLGPIKDKNIRLLEIGVAHGASMRLWEAYFQAGQIFGIDIEDKTQYDTARVKTLVADQGKREDLSKAIAVTGTEFDVIIDDGGHRMDQQQISFGALFPALKRGGMYIIEDIHTSFPNLYPGFGVNADAENSTHTMINRFIKTGSVDSQYLSPEENKYLTQNISSCAYFFRLNGFHSDFFVCWKK